MSSFASRRRFDAIATVRAVTMQIRIRTILPKVIGWPVSLAARNVERMAQGRAKRVCAILMSAAKRESLAIVDCGGWIGDWEGAVVIFAVLDTARKRAG